MSAILRRCDRNSEKLRPQPHAAFLDPGKRGVPAPPLVAHPQEQIGGMKEREQAGQGQVPFITDNCRRLSAVGETEDSRRLVEEVQVRARSREGTIHGVRYRDPLPDGQNRVVAQQKDDVVVPAPILRGELGTEKHLLPGPQERTQLPAPKRQPRRIQPPGNRLRKDDILQ